MAESVVADRYSAAAAPATGRLEEGSGMNTRDQLNQYLPVSRHACAGWRFRKAPPSRGCRAGRHAGPGADHQRARVFLHQPDRCARGAVPRARVAVGFALVMPLLRLNRRTRGPRGDVIPRISRAPADLRRTQREARSDAGPAGRGHHVAWRRTPSRNASPREIDFRVRDVGAARPARCCSG